MKANGRREYVKSKGEYVLLPVYVKRVAKIAAKKLIKNKNGKKKLRGGEYKTLSLHVRDVNDYTVLDLCEITDSKTELVLLSEEKIERLRVNGKLCIAIKIKDKDIKNLRIVFISLKIIIYPRSFYSPLSFYLLRYHLIFLAIISSLKV